MVDKISLVCKAGNGGRGRVSYTLVGRDRKKRPNGGSGGSGGCVYLLTSNNCFDYSGIYKSIKAKNGGDGSGNKRLGRRGEDLIVSVPIYTRVTIDNKSTDLDINKMKFLIATGGSGGIGNGYLICKDCPQPQYTVPPKLGQSVKVTLEKMVLGHIALMGPTNVGKSSLFKLLTGVDALIGNYIYTTRNPQPAQLVFEGIPYELIDLPGFIEGSSKNVAMRFVRKCEKVPMLILVLDSVNPLHQYNYIIQQVNQSIISKIVLVAINKSELKKNRFLKTQAQLIEKQHNITVILISVHKNSGISTLKLNIFNKIRQYHDPICLS